MPRKLQHILGNSATRPVFVIGTGRSGTHWLGHSLIGHPEVRATIEVEPMFGLSVRMALHAAHEAQLFDRLIAAYESQLSQCHTRIYLDKSHPNIWIAEKLKQAFPQSRFIGIERNPYATVASMMKHAGVSAWHRRWREFPIPNRFLGITSEIAETYDSLSLASQCAIRWLASHNKMSELKDTLEDDLFVISYELFAHDPADTIRDLKIFLGLHAPIPVPVVKLDSLNKWKTQLSDAEIIDIQNVVGFSPESFDN